jgi:chorismate mutase
VASKVERVKQHDEMRLDYMTFMMELKQQRREGYDEGRIENMLKSVNALMTKCGWSLDETMEALDISPEDKAIIVAKYQPV